MNRREELPGPPGGPSDGPSGDVASLISAATSLTDYQNAREAPLGSQRPGSTAAGSTAPGSTAPVTPELLSALAHDLDAHQGSISVSTDGSDDAPLPYLLPGPSQASRDSLGATSASIYTQSQFGGLQIPGNLSNLSFEDAQSALEDLEDEIPQAKPAITSHDRLWAELDALNADVERAKEIHHNRGFLGTRESEALASLRTVQVEFARAIATEEEQLGLAHYKELWNVDDAELLRTRLFTDRHFDLLSENVFKASQILDELASLVER